MNVTFRLPSEELEKAFLTRKQHKLIDVKGHRSVGGIRVRFTMPCREKV